MDKQIPFGNNRKKNKGGSKFRAGMTERKTKTCLGA